MIIISPGKIIFTNILHAFGKDLSKAYSHLICKSGTISAGSSIKLDELDECYVKEHFNDNLKTFPCALQTKINHVHVKLYL